MTPLHSRTVQQNMIHCLFTYFGCHQATLPPCSLLSLTSVPHLNADSHQRGNLQDVINSNTVNGNHFSEHEMMRLFKGTCLAVQAMHDYRAVKNSNSVG